MQFNYEHPLYQMWREMRQRCSNKKNKRWSSYGGRGIGICQSWENFATFVNDVGPRPSPKHSLDRINNDGNYEPGNVRWTTTKEQNRNNQRTRLTPALVKEIRSTEGIESARRIAKLSGASLSTVLNARAGHTWKDIAP